ncbi:MAG: S41 family peptidase, partial [Chloroflexi bacterium]|nr:S41 family peptidase [Chloroflexota bacterium]
MSKKAKILIITLLTAVTFILSIGVGCILSTPIQVGQTPGLDVINQAWLFIFQDYVDKSKLDSAALSRAAIEGMIKALDDPYTAYVDPESYKLAMSGFEGKIDGIGAQVDFKNEQIIIIAPIPDSPAAKAGIRAGDVVLEIDGKSTAGMSSAEAVLLIRGPKGTPVKLLILHKGETEPVEIEIVRAEIKLDSVNSEMRGDIAYINITHFSERTADELAPVLETITQAGAKGIVLNLRSNPGGILDTVVDVASFFLKEGVIVDVVDNEGKHTASSVKPAKISIDLPVVVLLDEYSASGSEVLAGALQDHGRAILAGTKTFGKGSVNVLLPLTDGSGIY